MSETLADSILRTISQSPTQSVNYNAIKAKIAIERGLTGNPKAMELHLSDEDMKASLDTLLRTRKILGVQTNGSTSYYLRRIPYQ